MNLVSFVSFQAENLSLVAGKTCGLLTLQNSAVLSVLFDKIRRNDMQAIRILEGEIKINMAWRKLL